MGGTNIDGVVIEEGRIIKTIKKATDKENLFDTIYSTLKELLVDLDKSKIKRINLSTTVSTNAIVEGRTTPVGMVIQPGPGMVYDNLACGEDNAFISGYIDHRGNVVESLDAEEIKDIAKRFKEDGIQACGAVTKFSTRNPKDENAIKDILQDYFPVVTMGHTMSGKLNFPRRVYTSYLNSAVHKTFNDFAINLKKSIEEEGIDAPLYILKADGGTMTIELAQEKPVETILSGPAASFMGISALLPTDKDAILLDVGGTTTDIFFLADGVPLFEPLGIKIDKYNTLVRSIYSVSIGIGGDSSIEVEDGELLIGPRRAGQPYALGGPKPTPTDAMITLGLISYGEEDREKADESMEILGGKLDLSIIETAELVLETMANIIKENVDGLLNKINSKPVYTIKELLDGKKIQAKLINIIGGPAEALAPILENTMKLPCYYPDDYLVANAIGAALARPTMEITMHVDTSKGIISVPELNIYDKASPNFTLNMAKETAIELVKEEAESMGSSSDNIDAEITEESSFNMVRGYRTLGKDIRVKAQIKPGLIQELRSDNNA